MKTCMGILALGLALSLLVLAAPAKATPGCVGLTGNAWDHTQIGVKVNVGAGSTQQWPLQ